VKLCCKLGVECKDVVLGLVQQEQIDQTRVKYFDLLDTMDVDLSSMFSQIPSTTFIKQFALRAMLLQHKQGVQTMNTYKLSKLFMYLSNPLCLGYDLCCSEPTT
jgi:hypothetical protein